jgi:hypothetical protein
MTNEYSIDGTTLKQRIEAIPESFIDAWQEIMQILGDYSFMVNL